LVVIVKLFKEISKDPAQTTQIHLSLIKLDVSFEHVLVQVEQLLLC